MRDKGFKINKDCIGCRACVDIAPGNFKMNGKGKAFVAKQPGNEEEEKLARDAMELCPVFAIEEVKSEGKKIKVFAPAYEDTGLVETAVPEKNIFVSAKDKIKETLDKYPGLKDYLISVSPKFKRVENRLLYLTVCRFVSFDKAAKTINVPVDNLIYDINNYISEKCGK